MVDRGRDRSRDAFSALALLSHRQVEELGPILVVVQANLAVQEVQEAPEEEEEPQDHRRRQILVVMESWSHLFLRFRV